MTNKIMIAGLISESISLNRSEIQLYDLSSAEDTSAWPTVFTWNIHNIWLRSPIYLENNLVAISTNLCIFVFDWTDHSISFNGTVHEALYQFYLVTGSDVGWGYVMDHCYALLWIPYVKKIVSSCTTEIFVWNFCHYTCMDCTTKYTF